MTKIDQTVVDWVANKSRELARESSGTLVTNVPPKILCSNCGRELNEETEEPPLVAPQINFEEIGIVPKPDPLPRTPMA